MKLESLTGWFASLAPRGWLLVGGAAALVIAGIVAFKVLDNSGKRTVAVARQAGTVEAVATGQAQTLEQLKDANDAEQDLRSSGERSAARFDQCLQDSRRPAACERYRPVARPQQLVPG
jgi:hypothetical protein